MKLKKSNTHFTMPHPFSNIAMGIAARECNTIEYNRPLEHIRGDEKGLIATITGLNTKDILFLNQVHGDRRIIADTYPEEDSTVYADADAVITSLPYLCPVVRTADCVPVFIVDPFNTVIAAVHSGWKGTMLNISGKTVDDMCTTFGSRAHDLFVYILPSIGPRSYQVQNDVARHFPHHISTIDNSMFLDLWDHITDALMTKGVPHENIHNTNTCNFQNNDIFFSHRRGDQGRNLNYIYITKN